jgi:hypothetical protein
MSRSSAKGGAAAAAPLNNTTTSERVELVSSVESLETPAPLFTEVVLACGGSECLTHEYWRAVATNKGRNALVGLSRMLFVVSAMAKTPVEALVVTGTKVTRVVPFHDSALHMGVHFPIVVMLHMRGNGRWHVLGIRPTVHNALHSVAKPTASGDGREHNEGGDEGEEGARVHRVLTTRHAVCIALDKLRAFARTLSLGAEDDDAGAGGAGNDADAETAVHAGAQISIR